MLVSFQYHRLAKGWSLQHPEDSFLCIVIGCPLKNNPKLQDSFPKLAIRAGLMELTRRQFDDDG
jgi:hypothetical protein